MWDILATYIFIVNGLYDVLGIENDDDVLGIENTVFVCMENIFGHAWNYFHTGKGAEMKNWGYCS